MSTSTSAERDMLLRRVARERNARLAAESILEEKSLELYEANVALQRTAENLQEQMQKYQSIFEFAAQGIVTVDRNWQIKSFNPAAEKIFQLTRENAVDRKFQSLYALPATQHALTDFDAHQPGLHQVIGLRGEGNEFAADLTTSLVQHKDETVLVALIRDRTEQQQLEAQLRHAQKMESVGQLAAGIAHEINTPVQFVGDNIRFLTSSFEELEALLELLRQFDDSSQTREDWESLQAQRHSLEEAMDLNFIRQEVPEALVQSLIGIERVSTIVKAMKEFSHPGEATKTAVDINEGLQSSITVSRNEWRYIAEVTTDLDKELPLIMGYPGDLNQAFLNIIVNAAHAIQSRSDDQTSLGKIHIATRRCQEHIQITIADNGCGIPISDHQKVFEPFYTTKQIGKGTGQGLAVVHTVIAEMHQGEINIQSEVGAGTKLEIRLPINFDSDIVQSQSANDGSENAT